MNYFLLRIPREVRESAAWFDGRLAAAAGVPEISERLWYASMSRTKLIGMEEVRIEVLVPGVR